MNDQVTQSSFKGKTRQEFTVKQVKAIMYAHSYQVDDKLIANALSPTDLRNLYLGKCDEFGSKVSMLCSRGLCDQDGNLVLIKLPIHKPPYVNIIRVVDITIAPADGWTDYGDETLQITFYRVEKGKIVSKSFTVEIDGIDGGYRPKDGMYVSSETEEVEISAYQLFQQAGMDIFYELANQMPMLDLIKLVR